MIERVARLICDIGRDRDPDQLEPGNAYGIDGYMGNGDPAHCLWRQEVELARSIIEAMREPTGAMLQRGEDSAGSLAITHDASAAYTWQVMIDAALI